MKSRLYYLFTVLFFAVSCSEDSSESLEAQSFMRIYDNNNFSEGFIPVDMVQTPDEGYIILSTKEIPDVLNSGIYLVKTDKYGKFEKDLTLEESLTNPLEGITLADNKVYFICMSTESQAKIVSADLNLDGPSITDLPLTYPSAASFEDNEFLILGYDQENKKTVFSRVGLNGNVLASRSFKIADDDSMEDDIMKHFLRTGTHFPFQVGKLSSGGFFFNGFSDYTFSLVFTNLSADDDVDGVVQGQQENGGFSSVTNLGGDKFATSYFNFGVNYILPSATLSLSSATSIEGLNGYDMREIVTGSKVQITRSTLDGKNILIYAANTRSKQIGLFIYEEGSGAFLGSKYLGFSNPYEVGHLTLTKDGGIAIAGTAYIAGRFARVCLMKLSAEEFGDMIQQ